MEQLDREMLHIMSMDSGAWLGYSDYVHLWYVHTSLMVTEGRGFLTSVPSHAQTPELAVHACFEHLKAVQTSKEAPGAAVVKDGYTSDDASTHFRWNGVCFAVVPQLPSRASSGV